MRNQGQRAAGFLVQKGGPLGWGGLQVQGASEGSAFLWGGEPSKPVPGVWCMFSWACGQVTKYCVDCARTAVPSPESSF